MLTFDINWLAVVVSLFANMVVGAMWYGPLFGKPWMKELGFSMEDIEGSPMGVPYTVAIFNSFIMAFILANVIAWTGASGISAGLLLGFLMWVGFTGFTFGVNHAFEGRSLRLWAINSGMFLFGLLIMGVILAVWK